MTFYKFKGVNTGRITCHLESHSDSEIQALNGKTSNCRQTGFKIKETTTAAITDHREHDDLRLDSLSDNSGLFGVDGCIATDTMTTKRIRSLGRTSCIPPPEMSSTSFLDSSRSDQTYHNLKLCTASGARLTIRYRKHRPEPIHDHNFKTPADYFCMSAADNSTFSTAAAIISRHNTVHSQLSSEFNKSSIYNTCTDPVETTGHINPVAAASEVKSSSQDFGKLSKSQYVAVAPEASACIDDQVAILMMDGEAAPHLINIDLKQEFCKHAISWPLTSADDVSCSSSGCGSNRDLIPQSNGLEACTNLPQHQLPAEYSGSEKNLRDNLGESIEDTNTIYPRSPPYIYVDHAGNYDINYMEQINCFHDLIDHDLFSHDADGDVPGVPFLRSDGIFIEKQADIWSIYMPELDAQIEMLNRNLPDTLARLQDLPGTASAAEAAVSDYFHEDQYLCLQVDQTYPEQNMRDVPDMTSFAQSSWTAFFELDHPVAPACCQLEQTHDNGDQSPLKQLQEVLQYSTRQDSFSDNLSLATCSANIQSDSTASGRALAITNKCKKLRKKRKRRISPLPNNIVQCLLSSGDHQCINVSQAVTDRDPPAPVDNHQHGGQPPVDAARVLLRSSPRRIRCTSKGLMRVNTNTSHYKEQNGVDISHSILSTTSNDPAHSSCFCCLQTGQQLPVAHGEDDHILLHDIPMASNSDSGRSIDANTSSSRARRSSTQQHGISRKNDHEIIAESRDNIYSYATALTSAGSPADHLKRRRRSRSSGLKRKKAISCTSTVADNRYESYRNIKTAPPRASSSSLLPEAAVTVMRNWFEEHVDFPFADKEQKHDLVSATGLTLSQVENWLSNYRHRLKIKKTDFLQGRVVGGFNMHTKQTN